MTKLTVKKQLSSIKSFVEGFLMKYFISFLLLLLVYSCSTEPVETGPFHDSYYCEFDERYYPNLSTYYQDCKEEFAEEHRKLDSIMRVHRAEKKISNDCLIDEVWYTSKLYTDSRLVSLQFSFIQDDSNMRMFFLAGYVDLNEYDVDYHQGAAQRNEYVCSNLFPPNIDSVFADSSCADTLGIRSLINVFENFPDSLCEEQINN